MKNKVMRVLLGSIILPARLLSSFMETVRRPIWKLIARAEEEISENDVDESANSDPTDASK